MSRTSGIYKITNPKGKIYIGQSIEIEKRWSRDYFSLNCKNQTKLYYSLKKYGPENHKFEIIEKCKIEDLLEKETYWKEYYKVLEISSLCCRIDGKGGLLSQHTKNKISESNLGVTRNKGRKQSKEEKKLRSKIKKGTKHSKSHIENMRKGMLGKNTKPIICINTNNIYNSIREASKSLNINERVISNNLLGYTEKTKNNLIFKYINI